MRVAIIGCGLIGRKRLASLRPEQLAVACDLEISRAEELVRTAGHGRATDRIEVAVSDPTVDAVVIATLNASLGPLALTAIKARKHVLVEKPGAITVAQIDEMMTAAKENKVRVRVGYNHRFHPSLQKARELVEEGAIGSLMFIRGRYGHGGRVGYEKEWRADPKLSGGGELIDQGVHLIDLAHWFLGPFSRVEGTATTFFWPMAVDDNAFLHLTTPEGRIAWLHVSCSEWKNLFSLEIYGRDGKLQIDGLGGSYGLERLSYYKMLPQMGPPETTVWEYPGADQSWQLEMKRFAEDIALGREPNPGLADAKVVLEVVETIYAQHP